MSALRVLLISPYPLRPGKLVGGVEAATVALAPVLAAQEDVEQVAVLCFHHGEVASYCEKVNDKFHVWFVRGQSRLALPTRSFLEVLRARRLAAEINPDVVHGQGITHHGYVATRTGPVSVVTAHGMTHIELRMAWRGGLLGQVRLGLIERMVKATVSRAELIISISRYDQQELAKLVRGLRAYIPNPVSSEFFVPTLLRDKGSDNEKRILFAGLITPRKNVDGIVRAFAQVQAEFSGARLLIVGPIVNEKYAALVRDEVRRMGLENSVTFMGHVENAELLRQMQLCNVLVLFSNEETLPTVIAQVMAVGKPVVASKVGGIPEMIEEGVNGFLVDPGDEHGLAERLIEVLNSPKLQLRMGCKSRELANLRYEPSIVARQTIEAYRRALNARIG